MTLANAILNVAVALVFGAISGFILAVIFRPWYDRKAEELENLTAEEAQAFADVFGKIAQRLKTPGK